MPLNSVPLDVSELIFDQLQLIRNPRSADPLKSCALVCRAWLAPARRRLFRSKHFDEHTDYASFSAILDSSPGIAYSVREVKLRVFKTLGSGWIAGLCNMCAKLTCVRWINIGVHLGSILVCQASMEALTAFLQSVGQSTTTLHLDGIVFEDETQPLRLMSLLPQLALITFHWCKIEEGNPSDRKTPCSSPALRRVEFTLCGRSLYKSVLQQTFLPRLRHLSIRDGGRFGEPDLSFEPEGTLRSLESLCLDYLNSEPGQDGMS